MMMDIEEKEKPTAKGPAYLIVIVLLWMVILFYVFSLISDKVEPKIPINQQVEQNNFKPLPEPAYQTNYASQLDQVILTRGPSGHYMHRGQINDEDVVFIVDTGASDISIPGHIAERLQLDEGEEVYFQTANGVAAGFKTVLDTVSLGDISIDGVQASINPNVNVNYILLGMSFLKKVSFSQEGNTLVISR